MLNPEEYVKAYDDQENPKDISIITDEIDEISKKEKSLVSVMPDVI